MLNKKLLCELVKNKNQFLSIFIIVFFGIMVYTGLNAVWYSMEVNVNTYYKDTNFGDLWLYGSNFSKNDLSTINKIDGVNKVQRKFVYDTNLNNNKKITLRLNALEKNDISKSIVKRGKKINLDTDGVWIENAFAIKNKVKINDNIKFKILNKEYNKKVNGFIINPEHVLSSKNNTQRFSDYSTFGNMYLSSKFLDNILYNQLIIDTSSNNTSNIKKQITKNLQTKNNNITIIDREEHYSYQAYIEEIKSMKAAGDIFPIIFFLVAVLVTITTMSRLISKERTQIGILTSLGFSKTKIVIHYISYGLYISILASIVGFLVGPPFLSDVLFKIQKAGYEVDSWKIHISIESYLATIICIASIVLVIIYITLRDLKEKPVMLLRKKQSKKTKTSYIQNMLSLKKTSFNFKWNIRDILRSKSRSLMAIFGVAGATMLLLCALFMYSSIGDVNNWQYERLHLYANKINFKNDINDKQAKSIQNKYHGALQIENTIEIKKNKKKENVSLSVIDSTGLLKFQDNNFKYYTLKNGIAISQNSANKINAKINDTIFWKLNDKWHKDKITSIYRTPFNQGITMNHRVFKEKKETLNYTSLLTNQKKIDENNYIINIQDKNKLKESFKDLLDGTLMISIVMIVVSILLLITILYSLSSLFFIEKERDFATLRVLGFQNKNIKKIIITQNVILIVCGIIIGIPLGINITTFVLSTLSSTVDIPLITPLSLYLVALLTIYTLGTIISFIISQKTNKINMIESLKDIE